MSLMPGILRGGQFGLRKAVTAQDIPPNTIIIGLALFMTLFVMGPTLDELHSQTIAPYLDGKLTGTEAYNRGSSTLKKFMLRQTRRQDLALFIHLSQAEQPREPAQQPGPPGIARMERRHEDHVDAAELRAQHVGEILVADYNDLIPGQLQ